MATLPEFSTFIDSIKNVMFAFIFVAAGFYMTLRTDLDPSNTGLWIGAAITVASVYIGGRNEKSKQEAVQVAKIEGQITEKVAKAVEVKEVAKAVEVAKVAEAAKVEEIAEAVSEASK